MREWRNGRRTRLRIWRRKAWRFKSSLPYQLWFFYCYFDVLLLGIVLRCATAWRVAKRLLVALPTARKRQKYADSNPKRYLFHLVSPCCGIIPNQLLGNANVTKRGNSPPFSCRNKSRICAIMCARMFASMPILCALSRRSVAS